MSEEAERRVRACVASSCRGPRHRRTQYKDHEIRIMLDVPSIDCALRKRRLPCSSMPTRVDLSPLQALLLRRNSRGEPFPWVKLLAEALEVFFSACAGGRLAEMSAPAECLEAWWNLARDSRGMEVHCSAIPLRSDDAGAVSENAKSASGKRMRDSCDEGCAACVCELCGD